MESSSEDWIKFNKKHKDSWETIQVDGVPKIRWKCMQDSIYFPFCL